MSVLGIVGSPRTNGFTAQVVAKTLEGVAKAGLKTESLCLANFHIEPCRDCHPTLKCWKDGKCYHKDDFNTISKKIDHASGLVLGSAVYYGKITRTVDNLVNKKMRHTKQRPKEGIPGIGIVVAGGTGGGYASALREIYHFYRIIGTQALKPISVTRFNLPLALDEAFQAGQTMASIIKKEEYPTGFQRIATFLGLPLLGFDYLQERSYLIKQVIEGAQRENLKESMEKAISVFRNAEERMANGDKAGAFEALEEAYKLATAIWNPKRR